MIQTILHTTTLPPCRQSRGPVELNGFTIFLHSSMVDDTPIWTAFIANAQCLQAAQ